MNTIYRGIGIGNNSVQAEAFRISPRKTLPELSKTFPNVEHEMVRYQDALAAFVRQLDAKSAQANENSVKEILYAQSVMAQDPELADSVLQNIKEGWSAESAVQLGMQKFTQELLGASDEFGERIADLKEIEYRIIQWLLHDVEEDKLPTSGEIIVVAEDLSPLETAAFTDVVKGVVTEKGGPTSHTAIICRQLGIPAIVACTDALKINNGTSLLVNPTMGTVEINGKLDVNQKFWWQDLKKINSPLAKVFANVGSVKDAEKVKKLNAQGVGLLRTEIFFLNTKTTPSQEEQTKIYSEVIAACPNGEIVFRTIDAGSDKPITFLNFADEANPALGVRGQRLYRSNPKFFTEQLAAIYQAAQNNNRVSDVLVMAPMIATASEASEFSNLARNIGFKKVGIMVEIPSIISEIVQLKGVVDFISVGTNDLSQYLFAADRQSAELATLLNPWQPALLKALKEICDHAEQVGIKVGVCGEAASDPLLCVFLMGIGVTTLSSGAGALSAVQDVVSRISLSQAKAAVNVALGAKSAQEAKEFVLGSLQG